MAAKPRIVNAVEDALGLQLRIFVDDSPFIASKFDRIVVERASSLSDDPDVPTEWVEISTPETRPVLARDLDLYTFIDECAGTTEFYRVCYLNEQTEAESVYSDPIPGTKFSYISMEEARAVVNPAMTDARLKEIVASAQNYIDGRCRQWFEPRAQEMLVDGGGGKSLHLSIPIISLRQLFVNDNPDPCPVGLYRVYSGRGNSPDDRRNPRVRLIGDVWANRFAYGAQNQKLVGTFGFVEPDGSTPERIRYAMMRLVQKNGRSPSGVPTSGSVGPLAKKQVDKGAEWYFAPWASTSKTGQIPIVGDAEIDGILNNYRAPVAVDVSGTDEDRMV